MSAPSQVYWLGIEPPSIEAVARQLHRRHLRLLARVRSAGRARRQHRDEHDRSPHAATTHQVGDGIWHGHVDDLGAEVRHEVGRGEMEVDAPHAAADRHERVLHRRRVDQHRPGRGRAEWRDRAALVAGHRSSLLGIGQGEAGHAEMRAELRPVESATAGNEHEEVVVGSHAARRSCGAARRARSPGAPRSPRRCSPAASARPGARSRAVRPPGSPGCQPSVAAEAQSVTSMRMRLLMRPFDS